IIVASVAATALTLGALGPEAALIDIALVGATIGGATAATIDFSNQMVDNMVIDHQSFFASIGDIDWVEVDKSFLTGFIIGGVSTFAGVGLGQVFANAPAAARIGLTAVGFGGGTFVGDIGAQLAFNKDHSINWNQAATDAVVATAFAGVLGTAFHLGSASPTGAADPTMTVRSGGNEFEVSFGQDG